VIERRIAVVFLVDRQGRILMQHRDANAHVSPNQWTMPGGRIEEGEEPIEAARREVLEETGIAVSELDWFWSGTRPSVTNADAFVEIHAYAAPTGVTQDEVIVGEGQAMLFVTAEEALALDLGVTAELVLPAFLRSTRYATLARRGDRP
jgi:8-oxo-dGTP pyrophosphatase MutT (NUDIX family)